jgi:hypothetical protein
MSKVWNKKINRCIFAAAKQQSVLAKWRGSSVG